jgi:hypothetical protein
VHRDFKPDNRLELRERPWFGARGGGVPDTHDVLGCGRIEALLRLHSIQLSHIFTTLTVALVVAARGRDVAAVFSPEWWAEEANDSTS